MTLADDLAQARSALTMIHDEPFNAEAPPEALEGDTTPTELHYVRSNFAVPAHDGSLEVGGAIEHPRTLTLDDLRAMPSVERAVTMECAGNGRLAMRPLPAGEPWGDYAVSTARWTGALLHQVLEEAKPAAEGVEVRFAGADHGSYLLHPVLAVTKRSDLTFVRSLTLAHATDPQAEILIAYEMNGEPLNPDHGAPFRLIVPHWYGVASVKWLKHIDVLTEPYAGEFETGHYMYQWADRPPERVTLMRVRARITDPARGATIPAGTYTVRGKAWSGTGPITNVDVSLTGEGEWHPAQVEPPKGPYQWQDWSFAWKATERCRHSLRARAVDAAGNVQPEVPPWNRLGYGNNAVEVSYVDVR
ncbi:molybdenum-dependent oxidoreductase-like protein [Pseudonocardia hierapolitana]|uniref:Molybdenum-dependent oxidoreductase-like protein n=1 Tax=Pseudonocardia hierapolitana TaxID=1128676 RepID=A0A561SJK6_9PSEU|nr:sulfite oxidase [Pseudonocardia hierapolitana]TWF75068.1 molybdenum-dependent oxidoreductase-like protein [Pseudonocardia hierapolitana]